MLLLQTVGSPPHRAMIQSVWNVSVTSAALLGDDPPPIDGASRHALVRPDGTFTLDGHPVERPLLVATSGTRPIFASGRVVAAAPGFELIEPFASGPDLSRASVGTAGSRRERQSASGRGNDQAASPSQ